MANSMTPAALVDCANDYIQKVANQKSKKNLFGNKDAAEDSAINRTFVEFSTKLTRYYQTFMSIINDDSSVIVINDAKGQVYNKNEYKVNANLKSLASHRKFCVVPKDVYKVEPFFEYSVDPEVIGDADLMTPVEFNAFGSDIQRELKNDPNATVSELISTDETMAVSSIGYGLVGIEGKLGACSESNGIAKEEIVILGIPCPFNAKLVRKEDAPTEEEIGVWLFS